jgi:hypothetical protein
MKGSLGALYGRGAPTDGSPLERITAVENCGGRAPNSP